jgi:hypothetical protein
MTTPATIEVVVRPDGTSVVETKGFTGRDCLAASRFLETALGAVQRDRLTLEFYAGSHAGTGLTASSEGTEHAAGH